jgi:transposase
MVLIKEFVIEHTEFYVRNKGYSIDDIADILEVHRNSVSSWILAKERAGISELSEKKRSFAVSQLNEADIKVLEQLLKEYPQSPKTILAKFALITDKTISMSTFRRVVKKPKLCWKRARKSLKNKRNQQEFEKAKDSEVKKATTIRKN